ncbi:D-alanyl-D-alanine carboxypeptidase family protein [Hyphomonas beringensis]|nr:D-alanyl-D-alanine carboxypeptidase family protein [Hyphomonas beringensis]
MMRRAFSPVLKAMALTVMLFMSGLVAQTAAAEKYASIVIDADTHEVLHARNADEPRYPASLTKVMTLYMLFDALKAGDVTLDEPLTVSRHAASRPPSNLKLRTGSTITVRDAIGALVNKSANDVAAVVGERLGGTESRFAQLMTVKAESLGMQNTRFMNASGLPDTRQLTTARDLAILAEAMLENHADYYHYFSQRSFNWNGRDYKNHNDLLGKVDGVDGIKTGYTRASGFNLMASAKRDNRRVIAIMLGGNTSKSRNAHVEDLVEAAFETLNDPANQNDLVFAKVALPIHPNGAAEPMLNGKPLRVIIAEGGSDDEAPAETLVTAQTSAADKAPAQEEATIVARAEPEIVEQTKMETTIDVAEQPKTQVMSVSEYEARQMGLAQ